MAKKILITGASGFIGSFLAENAISIGLETYAGIRKTSSTKYLQQKEVNFSYINFEDLDGLTCLLAEEKFDYIIHNAGITKSPSSETYDRVNAYYLKVFIDAIRSSGHIPEKFVFMSSLAAYGPAEFTQEEIVRENSNPSPVTNYGRSKLKAEVFLKSIQDIPYNIIRPTAVYGPREKDFLTLYSIA